MADDSLPVSSTLPTILVRNKRPTNSRKRIADDEIKEENETILDTKKSVKRGISGIVEPFQTQDHTKLDNAQHQNHTDTTTDSNSDNDEKTQDANQGSSSLLISQKEKDEYFILDGDTIDEFKINNHNTPDIKKQNSRLNPSTHDLAKDNISLDKKFQTGPTRLSTNARETGIRFDYAPDLCKDYNETGFCGFGDSCKFLHDRGDYKAGWELDAEWELEQERKRLQNDEHPTGTTDHNDDIIKATTTPSLPSNCGICGESFKKPIVETSCKHWFCEHCALQHSRKSKKCKVCGSQLDGTFKIVRLPSSSK